MVSSKREAPASPGRRRKYVPAVGPRLKRLLAVVFALFALLGINALYLSTITLLEWSTDQTYQNYFYQLMFLGHLVLGLVITVPVIVFGLVHMRNTRGRPNRRAMRVGYLLFASALILLFTGFVLTRIEGFAVTDPRLRGAAYWAHVVAPLACCWLFVLHRLAGPKIRWAVGVRWAAAGLAFAALMAALHHQDPRAWNQAGPESGEQYFFPSLARTVTGDFIPARTLMNDAYCAECHATAHEGWQNSAHRFSSFNNPAYLASIRETRAVLLERDGNLQGARFCAGCHDLVPFFSGAFDDPDYDDVDDPTASAGITCTGCHAITHVNSPRGNADYTIEEPLHYPFAFSENAGLAWINRQLVKAKPAFHKKTFLKPLHKTAEFCGACHKVHLPEELNDYKWLRGQNHYDSYLLSGVSGHGAQSFYYPPHAQHSCNGCHMQPIPADEFGAQPDEVTGELVVHDHMFPSANTALASFFGLGEEVIAAHEAFNEGALRLDIFALHTDGRLDGEQLQAPLRPALPALEPGTDYVLDIVIRTLKLGHLFTQGTSDSNEVWLDVELALVADGADQGQPGEGQPEEPARIIGRSGGRAADGEVDPWSHFVNSFVLDRQGRRIDRRNAQDIFVPLYTNQIPPGAADSVHYAFRLPADASGQLRVRARLRFRKFDTTFVRYFEGDQFDGNELHIMTLAEDELYLPLGAALDDAPAPEIPLWQRWNDYGIGLLRKGDSGSNKGELRQAEAAFREVQALGRPDGPLNLARVFIKEGRLDEAVEALERAASHDPPAPQWVVAWLSGLVDKQNGYLDEAIGRFRDLAKLDTAETRERGFDFSQDYRVLTELGQALVESARNERGEGRKPEREALLNEAREWFEAALALDPENLSAHYNLALIGDELGEPELATEHRALHATYRPDDNARDLAIAVARRRYPAADRAAEAVVIYDLQREGAYELPTDEPDEDR